MGVVSLKSQQKVIGGSNGGITDSDVKGFLSTLTIRRTKLFTYGFMLAFVFCTAYIAFCPSGGAHSPWFGDLFTSTAPYRSQFSSFLSGFFSPLSNVSSSSSYSGAVRSPSPSPFVLSPPPSFTNKTVPLTPSSQNGDNNSTTQVFQASTPIVLANTTNNTSPLKSIASPPPPLFPSLTNRTGLPPANNESVKQVFKPPTPLVTGNITNNTSPAKSIASATKDWSVEIFKDCDIFYGNWVRDDSYPLYPQGSCGQIDESFNCFLNGRPDDSYQKLRWQPYGCNIPRLNPRDLLERLRKKRLVFVGDSLNRNMWESLVCILKNFVKDKNKAYEVTGHRQFRSKGSYSFYFKDYDCSVEFFQSHFLVQEWEMADTNGSKTETLRLDIISRTASKYKDADIIIFNTGHWWTHEKTSKGKDYYQEGNRVYNDLSVVDAYRKALKTWAKWIDYNINPKKSHVFFRGFSANHFKGGRWNSGGQCDSETEPIKNDNYLSPYPWKMKVLESVLGAMKTKVSYLNITRMTDYRKDAHPSIYRKSKDSKDKTKSDLQFQDCSHWCLPGVPDSWNEVLYAQILVKQYPI